MLEGFSGKSGHGSELNHRLIPPMTHGHWIIMRRYTGEALFVQT